MQVLYLSALEREALEYLRGLAPPGMKVDAVSPLRLAPAAGAIDPQPPPAPARIESSDDRTCAELIADADIAIGGLVPPGFCEAAPRLRYWIVPFAGIPAATREALQARPGLVVLNSHYNAAFVAEHAWALLLAAAKRIVPASGQLRTGDWRHRYAKPAARFLGGATLLLIGYGAIGRAVVPHARACGMRILAVKRTPGSAAEEASSGKVEEGGPSSTAAAADLLGTRDDLHRWLAEADAIIVSLPATASTTGYLGREEFARMKPGVLLVNVGRGPAIDEDTFHEALSSGRLGGAGIDAWWNYPKDEAARPRTMPSRHDLSGYDNLVFSPHCASHVVNQDRARLGALGEILCSIAAGAPIGRVDLEAGY